MRRILIVGESNPYGSDPAMALYHLPRNASGNRLREILGLRDATYHALRKVNLCDGPWRLQTARYRAMQLITEADVLVLLGGKVQKAFGGCSSWEVAVSIFGKVYLGLPHPSGLNRAWGEPGAVMRARLLVKRAVPELPIGEAG